MWNPTAKVEHMKLTKVMRETLRIARTCHNLSGKTGIRFFTCPPTYNKVAGALVTMEDGKPVLDPMLVLWTVEWWTRDSVLDIIRPVLDAVCSKDLQNSKLQATTSQRTCLTCSLFCAVVSMNTQSGHFEDWCAPAESACKLRLMNDIIMTIESWQTWYIIYLYVFLFTHAHPSTDRNCYDTRSLGHVSHQDVFWLSLPASQQGAQPHHNTNRSTKTVYEFLVFYQR